MLLVFAILLIIILVVLVRCIVIVPQSNAYVTEWLGVYKDTWGAGLHIRTPFVERISRKVSLKEEAADFPPQPVITRDNVTMMIDTVVFFQVFDAKMYAYGVNRPIQAIENLSATTLRVRYIPIITLWVEKSNILFKSHCNFRPHIDTD